MEKEVLPYLHALADVLVENGAVHLVEEIRKKDFQMAQVLEVIIREDLTY